MSKTNFKVISARMVLRIGFIFPVTMFTKPKQFMHNCFRVNDVTLLFLCPYGLIKFKRVKISK